LKFYARYQSSAKDFKNFVITPRRIFALIPAVSVFMVWSIGITTSQIQGYSLDVSFELRSIFAIANAFFSLIFIFYWSKIILKRKNLLFWPIEYFGTMAFAVLPLLIYWIKYYDLNNNLLVINYIRLIFLVTLTESIVAFLIYQIQIRSLELEQHQISLVTFEEQFRSTIFNHLHDKVQSKLFSVGLQLSQIKSESDSEYHQKFEDIIAQLESIRLSDVKKISIDIVPPLTSVGLTTSILSLLKSQKPVLNGRLSMRLATPLTDIEEDHFGIGIYRIIEQAFINSLIHGKATECEVKISEENEKLMLVITNNGNPIDVKHLTRGYGFAVIDGWVTKLNGTWTISNEKGQVQLEASFQRLISQV
jgi:signal transduction histidine kinase